MKVNCLSCGHSLDLHESYDNYEGPIRCYVCAAIMTIHTADGEIGAASLTSSEHKASAAKTPQKAK